MFLVVWVLSCALALAEGLPPGYLRPGEKLLLSLEEVVNPQHTALIVVDVQNDFVYGRDKLSTPEGKQNPCEDILTPLNTLIDKCREIGVPVIYTFTVHGGDVDLPPYKARMARRNKGPVCMQGSKGGEFPDKLNKPLPGEPVVTKHGYDAFVDHDLNTLLQNRQIKSLIFSGIDIAVCVDSTLRHGFHLGYYCVLAKDISASAMDWRYDSAIKLLGSQYCLVATTQEIMDIWDKLKAQEKAKTGAATVLNATPVVKMDKKATFVDLYGTGFKPEQEIRLLFTDADGVQSDVGYALKPEPKVDENGNWVTRWDASRYVSKKLIKAGTASITITDDEYNALATVPVNFYAEKKKEKKK